MPQTYRRLAWSRITSEVRSGTGASRRWAWTGTWLTRLAPVACTAWLGDLLLIPLLPLGKRAGPLARWLPQQHVLHADVLVEFWPVDAVTFANKLPDRPVFRP